ncbi:MAG: hypothetical protein KAV87_10380 [Desulfobacteraceae bacterium]|nr:hypothetical protein [Desulfobacteraceae bacterium]
MKTLHIPSDNDAGNRQAIGHLAQNSQEKIVYFRFFLKARKLLKNIARNEIEALVQWMMMCYP